MGKQRVINETYPYAFFGVLSGVNFLCRLFCIREIDTCVSVASSRDCGRVLFGDVLWLLRKSTIKTIGWNYREDNHQPDAGDDKFVVRCVIAVGRLL